jgi:GTP-binding protein EngB required for normal cell division/predicted component of type VI protein secretion system
MNDHTAATLEASEFAQMEALRAQLAADVEEAAMLPGIDATALDALCAKLTGRIFNLVVAGEFKRGKSSVINALLGAEVLPTGVVPLTSIVTVLHHGAAPSAEVTFEDGHRETIGIDALADYVTERGNPKNVKRVQQVEATFPAPWLDRGFRLVDTPGIGSAYNHNTDVTRAYLPQADAVIFVASVEQPVSRSELQFLTDIRNHADRIFCMLNKTDYLSESELAESVAFSTAAVREALGAEVPVFPVSARKALQARTSAAGATFAAGGFEEFDAALRRFLECDSGAVWIASVRRHLSRLLSECRLSAQLELQAMAAPLATLEQNLHAFADRKTETLQQRADLEALLQADARRLVKERVEPDIEAFKRKLAQRLDAAVPDWLADAEAQTETSRQAALERRSVDEVRCAFDAWRAQEDDAIRTEFDRICERFWQRIQQVVDELLRYSADLFAIRFESVTAEPLGQTRSHFYYKFWQEPTSLRMMSNAAAGLLPGALGRAVRRKRARRRVAELVEMQSGRLRHDFERRIMEAMRDARREMLERIDATITSIETAIGKGRALKSSGEDAAAVRRREIYTILADIDAIAARRAVLA